MPPGPQGAIPQCNTARVPVEIEPTPSAELGIIELQF